MEHIREGWYPTHQKSRFKQQGSAKSWFKWLPPASKKLNKKWTISTDLALKHQKLKLKRKNTTRLVSCINDWASGVWSYCKHIETSLKRFQWINEKRCFKPATKTKNMANRLEISWITGTYHADCSAARKAFMYKRLTKICFKSVEKPNRKMRKVSWMECSDNKRVG